MSEIKPAAQPVAQPTTGDRADPSTRTEDIQLLSDLELALAGGGDTIVPWP